MTCAAQLPIALRAANLLRVGGRLVYSTCSFNPVENEAIVAELLRRTRGALRVVDVSRELPGLARTAGMATWRVAEMCPNLVHYGAYADVPERKRERNKVPASLFPPMDVVHAASVPAPADVAEQLRRCLRLLPHVLDSGGFFVAVLEKVSPWPAEAAAAEGVGVGASDGDDGEDARVEPAAADDSAAAAPDATTAAPGGEGPVFADCFRPLGSSDWEGVREFFGIGAAFDTTRLWTRSKDARGVYFVSERVSALLVACGWGGDARVVPALGSGERKRGLKIVHTGLQALARLSRAQKCGPCEYRLHMVRSAAACRGRRTRCCAVLFVCVCVCVCVCVFMLAFVHVVCCLWPGCAACSSAAHYAPDPACSRGRLPAPAGLLCRRRRAFSGRVLVLGALCGAGARAAKQGRRRGGAR